MADTHAMGRRAVDDDLAGAAFTCDHVGLESFAVVYVPDMDEFVGNQARALDQVGVDGDAADVIYVGLRDGRPVYFALEQMKEAHNGAIVPNSAPFVSAGWRRASR